MERTASIAPLRNPLPTDGIEACFRAYSGYVAAIALRLLGRAEEVDDVVQEVFLAAVSGLMKIREPAAAKAWLATVTARQARRRLRMRRVRAFLGLERTAHYAQLAVGATQEQAALVSRVYRILDELPADQRIAWVLRKVEGEELDAIAVICGCSLATAKRRIVAAQEAIEKVVGHE